MKPVMQTETGEYGNCFSACLASILELPIEQVPNFIRSGDDFWKDCEGWLRQFGLGILEFPFTNPAQWDEFRVQGHQIVGGPSRRSTYHHAQVWHGGRMVHDPNPNPAGIVAPDSINMLYVVDLDAFRKSALAQEKTSG